MKLLDHEYSNVASNPKTDIVGGIKLHPVVQAALLIGAMSAGGYFTIRFWKELQGFL